MSFFTKTKHSAYKNLFRDLFFIAVSIFISLWIVRLGVLHNITSVMSELMFIATFITGFFFTLAFTIVPATIVLAEFAHHISHLQLAFWGACGALVGDLTIFFFVSDRFTQDILDVIKISKAKKLTHFFKKGYFRWLSPLIGALIIASPLPDEIGITMMGVSKTRLSLIVPISFCMNFIALYALASLVSAV